jgi:hypothetical protein
VLSTVTEFDVGLCIGGVRVVASAACSLLGVVIVAVLTRVV